MSTQTELEIVSPGAFASVAPQMPGARLVILGPAHEVGLHREMMTLIEERGLHQRVIYAGAAELPDRYYAAADAFVCASYFEGGQLSLLEALAANLPIVTTRVGFACHFEGVRGVTVIEPPCDIWHFQGSLGALESSVEFLEVLAAAMVGVYRNPIRPDLPTELLGAMDKAHATAAYVDLVLGMTEGGQGVITRVDRPWPALLRAEGVSGWPPEPNGALGALDGADRPRPSSRHEVPIVVSEPRSVKG